MTGADRRMERHFYPRPPWGGRHAADHNGVVTCSFLSTPSVGRATVGIRRGESVETDFYPRPPWGGRRPGHLLSTRRRGYFYPRPPWGGRQGWPFAVSATAIFLSTPSVGRATKTKRPTTACTRFLSTPSVGRATLRRGGNFCKREISIHALRGEGDSVRCLGSHTAF